ncbi:MAG: methyltransferase domain-containing protein [Pseudomonadota bacterium]
MAQNAQTSAGEMPEAVDEAEAVHLKMFSGHDKGRDRRLQNGQYLADVLFPLLKPGTVIDLGCGLGYFLKAMADYGAEVSPVDNAWVKDLNVEVALEKYRFHDLDTPYADTKRYDLATSFEVAEHLKPERSEAFVEELCALSDVVAFSAAIPGQGGSGHINLRWQSEWATLFEAQGYKCFDAIRSRMAEREDAFFWFRQNAYLFIKDGTPVPEGVAGTQIAPQAANVISRNFYNRRMKGAQRQIAKLRAELAKYETR